MVGVKMSDIYWMIHGIWSYRKYKCIMWVRVFDFTENRIFMRFLSLTVIRNGEISLCYAVTYEYEDVIISALEIKSER